MNKRANFETGTLEIEEDGERLRSPFDGEPPSISKEKRKQLAKEQKEQRQKAAKKRADLVRKRQKAKEQMNESLPLEKKVNLIIEYLDL